MTHLGRESINSNLNHPPPLSPGNCYRNKQKYLKFLRLRCNVKPTHGPFHFRAPSRVFWRTVRGMLPHKLHRGKEALARLKVFDGIPAPYDTQKRKVRLFCFCHQAFQRRIAFVR